MEQVLWLSRAGLVWELELGVRVLHSDDERVVMFPFASVLGLPTNSPGYVASPLKVSVLSTNTNEGL